ncbi:hypothetical protein [Streptomyces carpinensis]|uniref:CdiI n=1 Tax=Streptomyces carpinensis TaxID=66369 RepID=A0ABV1VW05_9ACTN|nr:hypothetical protein [Streptomyces carpinensis]
MGNSKMRGGLTSEAVTLLSFIPGRMGIVGFYEHDGSLIEVAVLSDGKEGSGDWVVEFWDLTPGGPGELMHVHVNANGECGVDILDESVDESFVDWAVSIARSELL